MNVPKPRKDLTRVRLKFMLGLFKSNEFAHRRHAIFQVLACCFWYLGLFPGRLGFDYALLTRMVQDGEATAWWGATYYWIFRLLTFEGEIIYVLSLVGLLILTASIFYFIDSLSLSMKNRLRVKSFLMATPLYGVFGVNVSHDVFQVSGLLLFSGLLLRVFLNQKSSTLHVFMISIAASLCLLMTQTGIVISAFMVLLLSKFLKVRALIVLIFMALIYSGSGIGLPKSESSIAHVSSTIPRLLLVDLKCVVQHPDVVPTEAEWLVLEQFGTRVAWKEPVPCSNPDILAEPLGLNSLLAKDRSLEISWPLIQTYWSVVGRDPAIVVMSHIQRSRVALPPPFFQPPTNQVSWNVDEPIGLGTNTAIQDGPGLLHPSIDETSVQIHLQILQPLEVIAQGLTFLINQASWFWGWGGLWLYPILFFYFYRMRVRSVRTLSLLLSPTILLHLSIVLIGPSSLGRYVMSTVYMGFICLLASFEKSGENRD